MSFILIKDSFNHILTTKGGSKKWTIMIMIWIILMPDQLSRDIDNFNIVLKIKTNQTTDLLMQKY